MNKILKSCLNPKVLIGLGLIIALAYIFVPQVAGFSWILLVLACPVSMMLMMATMKHDNSDEKLFVCSECGYQYKEKKLAQDCQRWCQEHNSCNLEIVKYGISPEQK